MELVISYDEEGAKLLCDLFQQALEDKWAAEVAPKTMPGKKVVYIPHSMCKDGIVIF